MTLNELRVILGIIGVWHVIAIVLVLANWKGWRSLLYLLIVSSVPVFGPFYYYSILLEPDEKETPPDHQS
jgi:hypothetical protein